MDDSILDVQSFAARVQPIYQLLGWEWKKGGIPTVEAIEQQIEFLIRELVRDRNADFVECGGIIVRRLDEHLEFAMIVRGGNLLV